MNATCMEHSGLRAEIDNMKQNQADLWKAVNGMKNWVITGMAALVLQLALYIINTI